MWIILSVSSVSAATSAANMGRGDGFVGSMTTSFQLWMLVVSVFLDSDCPERHSD